MKLSAVLPWALVTSVNAGSTHALSFLTKRSESKSKADPLREEICRWCYRRCPVACSSGTCGVMYGPTINRYKSTNQCYSCDPGAKLGSKLQGDFSLCTAEDAGATSTYLKPLRNTIKDGTTVAVASAGAAAEAAHDTVDAAEAAAKHAADAAAQVMAAHSALAGQLANAGAEGERNQARQMAAQIRANWANKAMQAAHIEWQQALDDYNVEVAAMQKQQKVVDKAEEDVAKAEHDSKAARAEYVSQSRLASAAARDAAMAGGDTYTNAQLAQAQAEELSESAKAAQRNLAIAAKAAHSAGLRLGVASGSTVIDSVPPQPTLPPCGSSLLQTNQGQPCLPGSHPVVHMLGSETEKVQRVQQFAGDIGPVRPDEPDPEPLEITVDKRGIPDQKVLAEEMVTQIADRIAVNPKAAYDPRTFMLPGAQPAVEPGQAPAFDYFGGAQALDAGSPGTPEVSPPAMTSGALDMHNTMGSFNINMPTSPLMR